MGFARSIFDAMYLVDTNIVSLTAPRRAAGTPAVASWLRRHNDALFLSVITVTEIEQGIQQLHRREATRKATELEVWLDSLLQVFETRLLRFDLAAARALGGIADRARAKGMAPDYPDLIIAATASVHALTVLTRNTRHFEGLGVPIHDPYDTLPGDPA